MPYYALYDSKGNITQHGYVDDVSQLQSIPPFYPAANALADIDYVTAEQGVTPNRACVVLGMLIEKNVMPMPTKVTGVVNTEIVINNIPIGTTMTVNGNSYLIDDGTAELTFNLFGEYPAVFTNPQYYDLECTIVVVAS